MGVKFSVKNCINFVCLFFLKIRQYINIVFFGCRRVPVTEPFSNGVLINAVLCTYCSECVS